MKNWKPKDGDDIWTLSIFFGVAKTNPEWVPEYARFKTRELARIAHRDVKKVLKKARKA